MIRSVIIASVAAAFSTASACGTDEVFKLSNAAGTVTVSALGARIVSYVPAGGKEVFFGSSVPVAEREPEEVLNGGVPVCWPWVYNDGGNRKTLHGFVRDLPWRRVASPSPDECVLTLESSSATKKFWPHDFRLVYTVRLGRSLECSLVTENTGNAPFTFTEAFHPYFKVGDVEKITVKGLPGGDLKCFAHVKGVYENPKGDTARAVIADPSLSRRISVSSKGASRTVVWNRGKAPRPSYAEGDWRSFICVEPANNTAADAVRLAPGEKHQLFMSVKVEGSAK